MIPGMLIIIFINYSIIILILLYLLIRYTYIKQAFFHKEIKVEVFDFLNIMSNGYQIEILMIIIVALKIIAYNNSVVIKHFKVDI